MAAKSNLNFFAALLIILLAALLELRSGWVLNFSANFALATLITLVFFLSFTELVALTVIAAWLLNWQPMIGWEIGVFMFIPILFFAIRRFPPWQIWLSNIMFIVFGISLFYLIVDYSFFAGQWAVFLKDVAISLGWGAAIFATLSGYYQFSFHPPSEIKNVFDL